MLYFCLKLFVFCKANSWLWFSLKVALSPYMWYSFNPSEVACKASNWSEFNDKS